MGDERLSSNSDGFSSSSSDSGDNLDPFNEMVLDISDSIEEDTFHRMKVLCRGETCIPQREWENIKQPDELIFTLQKKGKISDSNVRYLINIFKKLKVLPLVDKLKEYQKRKQAPSLKGKRCKSQPDIQKLLGWGYFELKAGLDLSPQQCLQYQGAKMILEAEVNSILAKNCEDYREQVNEAFRAYQVYVKEIMNSSIVVVLVCKSWSALICFKKGVKSDYLGNLLTDILVTDEIRSLLEGSGIDPRIVISVDRSYFEKAERYFQDMQNQASLVAKVKEVQILGKLDTSMASLNLMVRKLPSMKSLARFRELVTVKVLQKCSEYRKLKVEMSTLKFETEDLRSSTQKVTSQAVKIGDFLLELSISGRYREVMMHINKQVGWLCLSCRDYNTPMRKVCVKCDMPCPSSYKRPYNYLALLEKRLGEIEGGLLKKEISEDIRLSPSTRSVKEATAGHLKRGLREETASDFKEDLLGSLQNPGATKTMYRGRVILLGAYGAGKTSTKRSLFNEPFEERYLSTDGAEVYNIDITEWIMKGFSTEYQGPKSSEVTQKLLEDVLVLEREKMKEYAQNRSKKQDENAADIDKPDIYLSLWDFAGQSAYYMTHQVFFGNRVIYLLVTDLTKSPDDIIPHVSEEWTVTDSLNFWMNSIHTHALPGSNIRLTLPSGTVQTTPAPPVILVGTKKDLLSQSSSSPDAQVKKRLAELNEFIRRNATKAANDHLVGVVGIDNKSRNKDGIITDPDVEKLRKKIQEYAMEYFFLGEVPVKWIQFELSMRQLQKEKILLEEAKNIGKKLEMTENEIRQSLQYYHSVGEIFYCTSIPELKDSVILDVTWLANLFNILIIKSMPYKALVQDVPPKVSSLMEELHHEGRLHEELLDYLLKCHDRYQDKDILLATAEMYDILFGMPDTESDTPVYYLPSLLQKDAAGKDGIVFPAGSKSCNPIYFHFHGNFLPEGLFYRLVVRCLKQWPNQEIVLRKHRARIFIENDDFHFTLCKIGSDIELKALIMPEFQEIVQFQPKLLNNVRSVVTNEIKYLIETYAPNMTFEVCIKCQCPNHRPGELLPGSEDTDDRCVAVREVKGKFKVICERSAKQLHDPDLKLWYGAVKAAFSPLVLSGVLRNMAWQISTDLRPALLLKLVEKYMQRSLKETMKNSRMQHHEVFNLYCQLLLILRPNQVPLG